MICVNRTDGSIREVPRESSGGWAQKAASSTPDAVWELPTGAVCFQPDEYKVVVGQGWPAIRSRFLDPRDPKNNVWRPNSVPSVQAQDWWNNYRRGACGRRKLDDDLSPNDILLEVIPSLSQVFLLYFFPHYIFNPFPLHIYIYVIKIIKMNKIAWIPEHH